MLVGRERELALLADALDRARRSGTMQLVTLVGVPGIGKSRLVWELLQTVEAAPELTVWAAGPLPALRGGGGPVGAGGGGQGPGRRA